MSRQQGRDLGSPPPNTAQRDTHLSSPATPLLHLSRHLSPPVVTCHKLHLMLAWLLAESCWQCHRQMSTEAVPAGYRHNQTGRHRRPAWPGTGPPGTPGHGSNRIRETIVLSGFEAHQHTGSFGGHRINLTLAEKQLIKARH